MAALAVIVGIFGMLFVSLLLGVLRTQLWIRRLGSPKRHVREQARSWLLIEGRSTTRLLIRTLHHDNVALRRGAAEVLGLLGEVRAILPLLDALSDKDTTVRWEVITALGRLQAPPAIERLRDIMKRGDKESRRRSVEALGYIGGREVVNDLVGALQDADAGVRKNAVSALAEQQRIDLLVNMLQDPTPEVRTLTAEVLTEYHWQPQNDREQIIYDIARQNWSSPLLSTPVAVDPLLLMLRDNRPENMHARVNAAQALGKIGAPKAFEPLVQMSHHIDATIRTTAMSALGDLKDPRALDVLIQGLQDTAPTVRAASATALANFDDPRSMNALIHALGDTDPARLGDRNPEVQRAAAAALKRMPDERVTVTLINALEDDDAVVRYEASEVLVQRGWTPRREEEHIQYALAREDWETVKSFGAQALPQLIVRSADKDRALRETAIGLLTRQLSAVKIVIFGTLHVKDSNKRITFVNPEVEALTIPMKALEHLVIHIPTYEFHRLERFLTYAINYVGQQHLKRSVTVHLYGDPTALHANLRNTLSNVCKQVKEHS